MRIQPNNYCNLPSEQVSLIQAAYHAADTNESSTLSAAQVVDCLVRLNVSKCLEWAERQLELRLAPGEKGLNFEQTLACIADMVGNEQVGALFKRYADTTIDEQPVMTNAAFREFMRTEQARHSIAWHGVA